MNLKVYTACVLAFFVASSLDAVPDPPAINSHPVDVCSNLQRALFEVCETPVDSVGARDSQIRLPWVNATFVDEYLLPADQILLTGHAADPSPPFSEARPIEHSR